MIDRHAELPKTFLRFVVVGGATAALYAVILVTLAELAALAPAVAAAVAHVTAVAFNYVAHHRWTYCTDRPHSSAGPRYITMVSVTLALNVCATAVLPKLFEVGYGVVQLGFAALIAALAFVGQSIWVFSPRQPIGDP